MKYRNLFGALVMLNIPVSVFAASSYELVLLDGNDEVIKPMDEQQLAGYRGGFAAQNDYIVNIGLSITTAIDGDIMLNSKIANLLIENGSLTTLTLYGDQDSNGSGLVNVIQNGAGNEFSIQDVTSSYRPDIVTAASITNVIQNTLDNSSIGLSTIVDIDAQVGDALKQVRIAKQLEEAVMARFY